MVILHLWPLIRCRHPVSACRYEITWCLLQREDYPKSYEDWYFILLSKCSNCGIEGLGRVDGQGSMWAYGG